MNEDQPGKAQTQRGGPVADLRLLKEAAARLAGCVELSTGLHRVLGDALNAVGATRGLLSLLVPENQDLRVAASVGLEPPFLKAVERVPVGVGSCGAAVSRKSRVVIPDVELDPLAEQYREPARVADFRACHSIPLFDREKQLVGVITALFQATHQPDERENHLLDLYGQMAAAFIERMQAEADDRNLQGLPEQNSAGVIRVSAKGVVIYASHNGKPLLGCWNCGLGGSLPLHLRDWVEGVLKTGQSRQRDESCGSRTFTLTAVPFPELDYTTLYAFDITEHKQAEGALRKSREQLRLFVEQAPAALAMFDRQMRYLAVSARWTADYHLPKNPAGQPHYEIFPDLPEKWKEAHRRSLAGEVLRAEEDSFTRADGAVRWERWETRPWTDARGEIGGILIFTEDITKRKTAEQALQARERELSLIFQNASDVLFYLAVEPAETYRFLAVNEAFLIATGLLRNQVVGKSVQEIIPQPSLSMVLEKYRHALQTGKTVRWEENSEYPAGRKTGLVSVTPLFGEDGQCQHLIGTVHDISEQKRAEEQLRLVADHAPGMIAYVDRNLVYGFNNAAYTQWLGIPASELAGRSVARVLRSEVLDHCLPYMKRALHGESVRFEAKSLHQELGLRDTEVTYIPDQVLNGPVRGFYVFIHDITERKQEARAMREAQERFELAAGHEALTLYEQDTDLRYTWFFPLTPPREQSLGKTDQELLSDEDGELLTASKQEVLRTGLSQRREVKITSFWPEPKYFDLIISPKRNESGQIIGIAGAALDITDLKRAEGNSSTS